MELRLLQLHLVEFLIGYFDPCGIATGIKRRFDGELLLRGRIGDQLDNDFMSDQLAATLMHTNMTKHAMFDLVPFAGAWRKMAHYNAHAQVVGQLLQGDLPQAVPAQRGTTESGDRHREDG